MTSSPHSDRNSRPPPSTMTAESSKKRQRSPSPTSAPELQNDKLVSSPPEKRRRFSITQQSPESAQVKARSPPTQRSSDLPSTTIKSTTKHPPDGTAPAGPLKPTSEAGQEDKNSSKNIKPSQSKPPTRPDTDRNRNNDRNNYRTSDRAQHRQSPRRYPDSDRYTPPPRRSRTRSPIRRRSPDAGISSVYRRRDPPPPPRRSRSPSPIRRSPPREDQLNRRPGGGTGRGRNVLAVAQRLAEEREREQAARNAQIQRERGVQHMSNQFYNSRPEWVKERGREWRKNESKIK